MIIRVFILQGSDLDFRLNEFSFRYVASVNDIFDKKNNQFLG